MLHDEGAQRPTTAVPFVVLSATSYGFIASLTTCLRLCFRVCFAFAGAALLKQQCP
jgi:hypothetical protein